MCLDLVQAMQSRLISWHNRHWPTEVGKCASSKVLVLKWLYGLCHDLSSSSSATIEGHHSSTEIFRSDSVQQCQGGSSRYTQQKHLEVHVHATLCCISCTQSSLVLRFKHALHGQNLLLITQDHGSNRKITG